MSLITSIKENIRILNQALGKEPAAQIVGNACRKLLGKPPVLKQNHENNLGHDNSKKYKSLMLQREALLRAKNYDLELNFSIKTIQNSPTEIFKTINIDLKNLNEDYILLVDSSYVINPLLLKEAQAYIAKVDADIYYPSEDCIDEKGNRQEHKLKPEWNETYFISYNYIGDALLIKKELLLKIDFSKLNPKLIIESILFESLKFNPIIKRIDDVLLHKTHSDYYPDLINERKKLRVNYFKENNIDLEVKEAQIPGIFELKSTLKVHEMISIIIPFRDNVDLLIKCVDSILKKSTYQNFEIILVNNNSVEPETFKYLKSLLDLKNILRLDIDIPFNFSRLNNLAAKKAKGKYLLFLNNDTEVINPDFLEQMVTCFKLKDVGVVGAKLLYEDDTVQHAGVLMGVGHLAGHAFRHLPVSENGYMFRAKCLQEYSAVTGACLLTKKALFESLDGFDDENLAIAYNDVDYCLKVVEKSLKIIFTPNAILKHYESKSRASDLLVTEKSRYQKECFFMKEKWDSIFRDRKFSHPFLSLDGECFEIKESY